MSDEASKIKHFAGKTNFAIRRIRRWLRVKRSHVPPIDKLPAELLIDIFSYCTELETTLPFDPVEDRERDAKIDLSHVCGRWRDIVFSMSHLWTQFTIIGLRMLKPYFCEKQLKKDQYKHPRARSLSSALQVWLINSGDRPFRLRLDYLVASESRRLVESLMPHIHRCTNLTLRLVENHQLFHDDILVRDTLASIFSPTLVNLRHLDLRTCEWRNDSFNLITSSSLFRSAHWQNLITLKWFYAGTPFMLSDIAMPNLTEADFVGHITTDQCARFLSGCPQLRSLCLHGLTLVDTPPTSALHKRLESLILHCDGDTHAFAFLQYFNLPSLKDLRLSNEGVARGATLQRAHAAVIDLVNRSSCPLKAFKNADHNVPPNCNDDYVAVLTGFQDLISDIAVFRSPCVSAQGSLAYRCSFHFRQ